MALEIAEKTTKMSNKVNKKRFFNTVRVGLLAAAIFVAPMASAGSVICTGKITLLAIHQPGVVVLRLSSMNTLVQVCSLNADWVVSGALVASNTAASCKSLYATMLAGKYADKSFEVYFDGDQIPGTCNNFASWVNVNLRYLNHID